MICLGRVIPFKDDSENAFFSINICDSELNVTCTRFLHERKHELPINLTLCGIEISIIDESANDSSHISFSCESFSK